MKTVNSIITMLITFPIRFYLMWYILTTIGATELPMFLFWASMPLIILTAIVSIIINNEEKH